MAAWIQIAPPDRCAPKAWFGYGNAGTFGQMTSNTVAGSGLREPGSRAHGIGPAVAYAGLAAVFFLLYYALSMRQQKPTTLSATQLGPPSYDIAHFGPVWFWGNVALDVVLAVMNAVLVIWTVQAFADRRRARRTARGTGAGAGGVVGSLGVAFATFGCPTCTVPLAGTLGGSIFASALPLAGTELKLLAAVPLAVALVFLSRARRRAACDLG